jgi:hypothetical protein
LKLIIIEVNEKNVLGAQQKLAEAVTDQLSQLKTGEPEQPEKPETPETDLNCTQLTEGKLNKITVQWAPLYGITVNRIILLTG